MDLYRVSIPKTYIRKEYLGSEYDEDTGKKIVRKKETEAPAPDFSYRIPLLTGRDNHIPEYFFEAFERAGLSDSLKEDEIRADAKKWLIEFQNLDGTSAAKDEIEMLRLLGFVGVVKAGTSKIFRKDHLEALGWDNTSVTSPFPHAYAKVIKIPGTGTEVDTNLANEIVSKEDTEKQEIREELALLDWSQIQKMAKEYGINPMQKKDTIINTLIEKKYDEKNNSKDA